MTTNPSHLAPYVLAAPSWLLALRELCGAADLLPPERLNCWLPRFSGEPRTLVLVALRAVIAGDDDRCLRNLAQAARLIERDRGICAACLDPEGGCRRCDRTPDGPEGYADNH